MEKKQGMVIAAVGAVGCVVLLAFVGVLGFFLMRARTEPPSASVRPAAPAAPAATAGYVRYAHSANCLANANLVLPSFTVDYPVGYQVMPCTQQAPSPWSYVTFHRETPAGAEQITVSWGHGAVTPDLLGQAADDLVRQLGAPATRELGRAPFAARGAQLVRRDAAFDVPRTVGPFLPGTYVFRQAYLPRQPEGATIMLLAPARGGEQAALAATEPTLRAVVESFTF